MNNKIYFKKLIILPSKSKVKYFSRNVLTEFMNSNFPPICSSSAFLPIASFILSSFSFGIKKNKECAFLLKGDFLPKRLGSSGCWNVPVLALGAPLTFYFVNSVVNSSLLEV